MRRSAQGAESAGGVIIWRIREESASTRRLRRDRAWHTTYSYPGVNHRLRSAAVTIIALLSFIGCRGRSPDAGGDVALAHDLAEAQLAGSSASAGGRVASDSTDVADSSSANAPPPVVATSSGADPQVRAASSRRTPVRTPRVARKAKPADPCASSESENQNRCLTSSVDRSNARLDSIYRLIVKAVRKQQRTPSGAADPPYVGTLGKDQKAWESWRDAECERVTHGKGGEKWAVPRASCLATQTDARAAELAQILAKVRQR